MEIAKHKIGDGRYNFIIRRTICVYIIYLTEIKFSKISTAQTVFQKRSNLSVCSNIMSKYIYIFLTFTEM